MCTIAILVDVVAGARIVIAANRDELYARDTRPPQRLDATTVGGLDAVSGGTWLALRADGAFAAVTNQRALAPQMTGVRSRGLVVRELAASTAMDAYVDALDSKQYASMNLVWAPPGERPRIAYLRHAGDKEIVHLGAGIHVLCNDRLGAPGFPRGERLAVGLAGLAPLAWPAVEPAIERLLGDHALVEPDEPSHLPPEIARAMTAACIHTAAYGTRSSSIIAIADRTIAYRHADGPPCTTAFEDRGGLLA